ncbi:MAG: hypothetical protein MJE77_17380, partial [Proteobacteria bacterium]|nr:hypothetical protein [Pseudomonadota bacterium]
MIRWLLPVFVGVLAWTAHGGVALACSCARVDVEEAFTQSDAILIGEVVTIEQSSGVPDDGPSSVYRVTVRATRWFKGESQVDIAVHTSGSDASCGFAFEVGQSYLIYASRYEGILGTGLCTRTRLVDGAEDDIQALERLLDGQSDGPPDRPGNDGGCAVSSSAGSSGHHAAPWLFALALLVVVCGQRASKSRSKNSPRRQSADPSPPAGLLVGQIHRVFSTPRAPTGGAPRRSGS